MNKLINNIKNNTISGVNNKKKINELNKIKNVEKCRLLEVSKKKNCKRLIKKNLEQKK